MEITNIIKKILYLLLLLFTLYMGGMYWSPAILLVFFLELLLFVFSYIQSFFLVRHIHVSLKLDDKTIGRGDALKTYLVIQNTSNFPINAFEVQLTYQNNFESLKEASIIKGAGAISGKDTTTMEFTISSKHCGKVEIVVNQVKVYDYLSLFCRKKKQVCNKKIIILPKERNIPITLNTTSLNVLQTYKVNEIGNADITDFTIREYRDGDSIKHMHWKLTAKTDELWMKEHHNEEAHAIRIYLDLYQRKQMSKYDWDAFLEILGAICLSLLQTKTPHSILWTDVSTNKKYAYDILTKSMYLIMMEKLILLINDLDITQESTALDIASKTHVCLNTNLQVLYNKEPILSFTTQNYEKELREKWLKI